MNPSTQQARALVAALAKHGVGQVVLAPGSRNAPLSLALTGQSALELHVRIDERTAAFTALGMAKASGRPVAVVCTSGTAVANLVPAAFEAHEAGVPLLFLTADRPPAVRGQGANQTIDQVGIFNTATRAEWDLPLAAEQPDLYWELAVANAVAAALGDAEIAPGPVHLNLPFAEPLVPDADDQLEWAAGVSLGELSLPRGGEPVELGQLLAELDFNNQAPRGAVVISDPRSARPALALAKLLSWPVLAEPGSSARDPEVGVQHYARLLSNPDFVANHRPDIVITAGRFGLSRAVNAFVRSATLQLAVGRAPLAADPFSTAARSLPLIPLPLGVAAAPAEWLQSWQVADRELAADIGEWSSRSAVALLLEQLGRDDLLWVAASQSVRVLDDLLPLAAGPRVLMNRGANGIDGLIASASGAALMHGRSHLLIGDVAFQHDLASLVIPRLEQRPDLRILVLANQGGAIFRGLEQGAARFADSFARVFGTPSDAGLAAASAALGWSSIEVSSPTELEQALAGSQQVIVAQLPEGS